VLIIDLVEVEFLRAEAKERGYSHLWYRWRNITTMPCADDIFYMWGGFCRTESYLSQPKVAYSTAGGWKKNWFSKNVDQFYTTVL
jgi:hypothetical protein